jgi:hypothetical protein
LALDKSIQTKYRKRPADTLRLVYPGSDEVEIELLLADKEPVRFAAQSWHPLPDLLIAPFMGNWPDDAQPFIYGPRAVKVQAFYLDAAAAD